MSLNGPFPPIMDAFSLLSCLLFDIFSAGMAPWCWVQWAISNFRGLIPHSTGLGISLCLFISKVTKIFTPYRLEKTLFISFTEREFSVFIYMVFAKSGGVCIYNTACHSTEILVSIGHWHSVGECSLVICNAGCASTTTACVPAEP